MANLDNIHQAIQNLYPGAVPNHDYLWVMGDDDVPYMAYWNDAKLGPLDMNAIEAESIAISEGRGGARNINTITRRQFFQGLAVTGEITEAQAVEALATGKMPDQIEVIIDTLPTDQKFPARMLLLGANEMQLTNPLTQTFAAAKGWDEAETKAFFDLAALL
jgi:hypothetical protein